MQVLVHTGLFYFVEIMKLFIPEVLELNRFLKNWKTNIFRLQSNNLRMCGYICFGFIGFMFSGQTLIDFTSLFSPYDFEKRYYHSEIF